MRRIEPTKGFKRDYKRALKGPHRAALAHRFTEVVSALANDQPLPERCRDHQMTGVVTQPGRKAIPNCSVTRAST